MLRPLLLSLMLVGSIGAAQAETKAYSIDPTHTQVHASYLHAGFSNIAIRFNTVEGEFLFDAAKPANSSLNIKVPINSLDTGVAKFDTHLWSPDFFDAATFPPQEDGSDVQCGPPCGCRRPTGRHAVRLQGIPAQSTRSDFSAAKAGRLCVRCGGAPAGGTDGFCSRGHARAVEQRTGEQGPHHP